MRRLHDAQDGTSLTEFAIIAPLFIALVMWSQFFTDYGIFKLKVQEAARYGLWEMTAQRPMAQVRAEITDRFADLASPESRRSAKPTDALSFTSGITVTVDTFTDNAEASFSKTERPSSQGSNGVAG
jgi:Flp pilus assembly protein TadG